MSRDRDPEPDDDRPEPDPAGRLGTTRPTTVLGLFLAGLVLGSVVRPLALTLDRTAPRVGWLPGLALLFVGAVLLLVAHATRRSRRQGPPLEPHQAVNRLVLAKACALAGALVAGGYAGYALAWLGAGAELAGERVLHSGLAAVGAAVTVTGSMLLERACRVQKPGP